MVMGSPVPGSFRDPSGFLFTFEGNLYRQVNQSYQPHFDHLMHSGLYDSLVGSELLVPHEEAVTGSEPTGEPYLTIKPMLIPFISYPYEWSFEQLKAAALTTLEIQKTALDYDMVLKDASAYNIQYVGSRPVFIDTLSFEKLTPGSPWVAYRQFCEHFLLPLLLIKYVDPNLIRLLQTNISGIPLSLGVKLLPFRSKLRPSSFIHVVLHARSQERYANDPGPTGSASRRISELGLRGLIENLESTVRNLVWRRPATEWGDYYEHTNYTAAAMQHKRQIVERFLARIGKVRRIVDLGANTGEFSGIAQDFADTVVSLDVDPVAVDKHFEARQREGNRRILPLCVDLTSPSPSIGWANSERQSIFERSSFDTAMALALIHHLAISNNVPLSRIAQLFARLTRYLVIEFIPKSDSQVQRLLRSRHDIFDDYHKEGFEASFGREFVLLESERIAGSERILYLMERK